MKLTKKWLATSIASLLMVTLLSGCSDKTDNPANIAKVSADKVFKDAYIKVWDDSYNYNGHVTINITPDETAIIGAKGGLNEEIAEYEQEMIEQFSTPETKQVLEALNNGKFSFNGAYDAKNSQFDLNINANFKMDAIAIDANIPIYVDYKDDINIYIDPQSVKQFNVIPPQLSAMLDGKLVKFAVNDLPMFTAEQKAKFKSSNPIFKNTRQIIQSSINDINPAAFKDIELTDSAKKAGAVRTIQITLTVEEMTKLNQDVMSKLVDVIAADAGLSADDIKEMKEGLASEQSYNAFINNTVSNYSLNDKGQFVELYSSQSFKGAKHTGEMTFIMTISNYDKPVFLLDPSKKESINAMELMMMLGGMGM